MGPCAEDVQPTVQNAQIHGIRIGVHSVLLAMDGMAYLASHVQRAVRSVSMIHGHVPSVSMGTDLIMVLWPASHAQMPLGL